MDRAQAAVESFRGGCACSQAVLGAFGPRFGLDEETAMRVSAGFAGGMRMAETCGAVTGALMVLGLAHCDASCRQAAGRKATYGAITAFASQFRARHGALSCRELLGCDISTPEGALAAQEQGLFRTRCVELVRGAAQILDGLLPADGKA